MKPIIINGIAKCPECKAWLSSNQKTCECGQAIDWSGISFNFIGEEPVMQSKDDDINK